MGKHSKRRALLVMAALCACGRRSELPPLTDDPDGGARSRDGGRASDGGEGPGGIDGGNDGGWSGRGKVGPSGGSVEFLRFGVTGDTRPKLCNNTKGYPVDVINKIADALKSANLQFAMDAGDHMFACIGSTAAKEQMDLYMSATARFASTWFMTMGNHECSNNNRCLPGSNDNNFVAFMDALQRATPWYTFDVVTSLGLARFVVAAETAWGPEQEAWLESTLSKADAEAQYTIVVKHYPTTHDKAEAEANEIVLRHKRSLIVTGHSHRYDRVLENGGREATIGMGGAPLTGDGSFFGYALVEQQPTGELQLSVYNVDNGSLMDRWSVGPN